MSNALALSNEVGYVLSGYGGHLHSGGRPFNTVQIIEVVMQLNLDQAGIAAVVGVGQPVHHFIRVYFREIFI